MTFETEVIERLTRVETTLTNHLSHKDKSQERLQWLIGLSVAAMAVVLVVK